MSSAALTEGTTRVREPSGRRASIAMPKLTCSGWRTAGLPSANVYESFISGIWTSASIAAKATRWVKLTLPPRVARSRSLTMARLSNIVLAGISRNDVAVGMASEASMLAATDLAVPFMRTVSPEEIGVSLATSLCRLA